MRFHARKHILFAFLVDCEAEEEFRTLHFGLVGIVHGDGDCTAVLVRDDTVVAAYFLTLECLGSTGYFGAVESEVGGHSHGCVLHEEFQPVSTRAEPKRSEKADFLSIAKFNKICDRSIDYDFMEAKLQPLSRISQNNENNCCKKRPIW